MHRSLPTWLTHLITSGLLVCLPDVALSAEPIKLMTSQSDALLVYGILNDKIISPMMLDTGATHVAVNQAVADLLGLKAVGVEGLSTATGPYVAKVVMLDSIQVNGTTVKNVKAVVLPKMEYGVILGTEFFKGKRLTIDFKNRQLVIDE